MDPETHFLFFQSDRLDPAEWYAPNEFNHTAALKQVCQVQAQIEFELGSTVTSDYGYQNATCFAALTVDWDSSETIIRFSNFDQMAVVFCWSTEGKRKITDSPIAELIYPVLLETGFVIVRPQSLNEDYDGELGPMTWAGQPFAWFQRFFDYT